MRWKVPAPVVAPIAGSSATKRTTIPIPPSQFVMLLQKRIPLQQPSIPVLVNTPVSLNVVAPVVVNPLMISKNAAL